MLPPSVFACGFLECNGGNRKPFAQQKDPPNNRGATIITEKIPFVKREDGIR